MKQPWLEVATKIARKSVCSVTSSVLGVSLFRKSCRLPNVNTRFALDVVGVPFKESTVVQDFFVKSDDVDVKFWHRGALLNDLDKAILNDLPLHRKVDRSDRHFVGRHGEGVVEVVVPHRGIKQ